jgi:hypothetical protein
MATKLDAPQIIREIFDATNGALRINAVAGNGIYADKIDATVAPDANDDSADTGGNGAFEIGSVWIDVTGDKAYINVDATPTAAVWTEITGAGSGIADIVEDLTPQLGGDLDLNGNAIDFPTTAGITDVLDEDNMATDSATVLATQQSIKAYADTKLANVVEDTTPQLGGQLDVNGNALGDGTLELITFTEDASAVNHVNIENEATGSGPIISAAGDDADVNLLLTGKGTGTVFLDGVDSATFGTLSNVVEDTTPQLGGSLDVNGNSIVSVAAGDIAITPDTTGNVILDGLSWPQADGSGDQFLQTDGLGQLVFATPSTGTSVGLTLLVRNDSGVTINPQDPVYITGWSTGQSRPTVARADSDSQATMPSVGIASATILNNANGQVTVSGSITGLATSGFTLLDKLYVGSGGGVTATKPSGATTVVQKVAIVSRDHASAGVIEVFGPGKTNDFPNIMPDDRVRIVDNGDNTKIMAFQVSGLTTATTRTVTMPDQDVDLTPGSGSFIKDIVSDTTPQLGGDLDLNGNNIDFPTTANISDCLDEDNMSTDSATALATQQSIKAYADTKSAVTRTVNAQTGTTYQLVLGDAGDVITMSNASANTLTIPTNATVAFAVGTQIEVIMLGAGVTTVDGDTAVTVNGVSSGGAAIDAQYNAVTILKTATDTWVMMGAHGTVA